MSKKLRILKEINDILIGCNQPKQRYYTIREKKEMVLRGEDIPLCAYSSDKIRKKSIIPIRHTPISELKNIKL